LQQFEKDKARGDDPFPAGESFAQRGYLGARWWTVTPICQRPHARIGE